ncbi:hypothetical protein H6783_03180 [Candidatus Nomurabacteria bacterium]|nr:hypothetical protein [Candidatus Nomurabacteria bacterium]
MAFTLLQPCSYVLASETDTAEAEVVTETQAEKITPANSEPEQQTEEIDQSPEESGVATDVAQISETVTEDTPDQDLGEEIDRTLQEENDELDESVQTDSTEIGDDAIDDSEIDSDAQTAEVRDQQTTSNNDDETLTEDENDVTANDDEVDDTTLVLTDADLEQALKNKIVFAENECVSMNDGSYYCNAASKAAFGSTENDIYADIDAQDGDYEIFFIKNGKVMQLTDNAYDDTKPVVDPSGSAAVWQRLVNGRYQIVSYDLNDKKETVLSLPSQNSMEPSVDDGLVAWQEWDGHDWEIVLFDGSSTTALTNNEAQDLSPSVSNGFVLWQTMTNLGSLQSYVYDHERQTVRSIDTPSGGEIKNARYMLVYDTEYENGDVVTSSFDPRTGESRPVASTPGSDPEPAAPLPQTTDEVKVLITTKTIEEEMQEVTGTSSVLSASSTGGHLPLIPDNATTTTITSDQASSTFELTPFDIVIEPLASTTEPATSTGTSTTE